MNQLTRIIRYSIPRALKAFLQSTLKPVLRPIGFLHVDYGSSCGRNWITIDGYEIAQSPTSTVNVPDEIIERIIYHTIDHGKHYSKPFLNVIYQPILVDSNNEKKRFGSSPWK